MKTVIRAKIGRIAETQYFIRRMLEDLLERTKITEEGRRFTGNAANYLQYWQNTLNDKFFDMGTLVRLATTIESGLRDYYMSFRGFTTLQQLSLDPNFSRGIFQRIQPWQGAQGALHLFQTQTLYPIATNPHLPAMQELMLCRHLYAHNAGLLDEDWLDNYRRLTGNDLRTDPRIMPEYPQKDLYWFEPLDRINFFIEESRRFFALFP